MNRRIMKQLSLFPIFFFWQEKAHFLTYKKKKKEKKRYSLTHHSNRVDTCTCVNPCVRFIREYMGACVLARKQISKEKSIRYIDEWWVSFRNLMRSSRKGTCRPYCRWKESRQRVSGFLLDEGRTDRGYFDVTSFDFGAERHSAFPSFGPSVLPQDPPFCAHPTSFSWTHRPFPSLHQLPLFWPSASPFLIFISPLSIDLRAAPPLPLAPSVTL